MGVQNDDTHALEIMLTGSNNKTLRGFLNFTALETGALQDEEGIYDSKGAATFVVVVILVYGLSIVLMIGSLAKKNMKMKDADAEEKQIHIYLNQASDIKEKGAKENYRQLKRSIISIVNKSPGSNLTTPTNVNYDRDLKTNAIRSLIAVGGPLAVATGVAKGATNNGGENNGSVQSTAKRGRQTSDSESLQALLEEDEPSESPKNSPMTTQPQVTPDSGFPEMYFTGAHLKLPKDTIVITHTSGLTRHVSIAPHPKQTTQQKDTKSQVPSRDIPRVVVPVQQVGRNRSDRFLKPLDIARARDTRLSSLEPDNKIICNVDGSSLQDQRQSCKLTMDVDGNIWILQSSPNSSRSGVAPSPSTSTPGSIGYESFKGITPTPTPSPNPRQSPTSNEEKLQSSADAVESEPTPISPSYRREESASPAPRYSCFDPKRPLARTVATSTSLGEERIRRTQQIVTPPDTFSFLGGKPNAVTSSPQQDPRSYSIQPSVPHLPYGDTDDEELVQITSV